MELFRRKPRPSDGTQNTLELAGDEQSSTVIAATDPPEEPGAVTAANEVLRVGTFTEMDGQAHQITAGTLEEIAATFDRDGSPVPAVVGHPKSDDPAYGWVRDVSVEGDRLVVTLFKVDPGFAKSVEDGRYRKVSVKLYGPEAPNNPTPGQWSLRHVGFLGAAAPAVSGLKPVEFASDDDTGLVEFQAAPSVMEHPQVRRALARRDDRDLLEELVDADVIHPRHVNTMVEFMDAVDAGTQDYAFAADDGSTVAPIDWLRTFLKELATVLPSGQIVTDDMEGGYGSPAFMAPPGYDVDRDQLVLHARIAARAAR